MLHYSNRFAGVFIPGSRENKHMNVAQLSVNNDVFSRPLSKTYQIRGGSPVSGKIQNLGAKNFATKAMVGCLLSTDKSTLTNVPNIGDIEITTSMLKGIGANIESVEDRFIIDGSHLTASAVPLPDSGSNRIPILLLSVLLHRLGEANVPFVAGCDIGPRPVDFHLKAAELFGATVEVDDHGYKAYAKNRLKACHYELPYPSVGGTESCLFLAVLASGTSVIKNVAIEPEIISLITMLNAMGGRIQLDTNRTLTIFGVDKLYGVTYEIIGDRIEAASWAALAAATDGEITVDGIEPSTLVNFFGPFNAVGGGVRVIGPKTITFYRKSRLVSTVLETDVYPGFATDWQQPFAVLLTQAAGVSVIHETVYERRFDYLDALKVLGAQIQLEKHCLGTVPCRFRGCDHYHSAIIQGPRELMSNGATLKIPDLRAGLAYVMAAALAKGETYLKNIPLLERGYGVLEHRVKNLNIDMSVVPQNV
jgi:UDP-N-acetylglucosamine 1-carboxyvinyltransferase